jgi:hypothetical protein
MGIDSLEMSSFGCGVGFVGGNCEGGNDGVSVVVALDVFAEEFRALYVE